MLRLLEDKIATPLGPLWVIADEQFVCAPLNGKSTATAWKNCLHSLPRAGYERIRATNPGGLSDKLAAYFEGDLSIIDTLPTATAGTLFSVKCGRRCGPFPAGR
jgi:methylated-DNA-[protein]-cysteine S-methyltransferase